MNHRLTLAAGAAVVMASISEFAIISGAAWLFIAAGAVLVVALAGTLSRVGGIPAAAGAALLAAAASVPLFESNSIYLIAAGLAITAACAASATGLRLLPAFATLISYLSALLLYLNFMLAGPQSAARLLPTTASLHHLVHLANAATALSKLPPPVPDTRGVQLLAAASIGLAAIVVDIIAVRLRRPAIAGLPLLVLFMAPITTAAKRGGIGGAFTFLLAAGGYLLLLSADGRDRLRGWGRVVTVWHYSGEDERLGGAEVGALAATGRRIGLAAVCMALVVPLVLPTVHVRQLFHGGGNGPGAGNQPGEVRLPDPVDQLHGMITREGNQPVLTYQTSTVNPGQAFQPTTQYLRVYVLNYDPASTNWKLMPPSPSTAVVGNLQPPPGLAGQGILTTTTVKFGAVDGYASPLFFLPVPYWPTAVTVPGSWRESNGTLMIFSGQGDRAGMKYTVTSQNPNPSPAQLEVPQRIPAEISSTYLGFNSPVTARLRTIARRVIGSAGNAFAKAVALENWFQSTGNFTYSLQSTIPDTPAGLLRFLTTNRQGFCQQFAFAFAVLARLIGIPSRVAIGYTAGHQRLDHTWVVTTSDAHAWPELYFTDVGWVRFEPTPGGSGGQGTAVAPPWVTASERGGSQTGPGGNIGPSTSPSATAGPNIGGHVRGHDVPGGNPGPTPTAPAPPASKLPLLLGLIALLLLAIAVPGSVRVAVRARRWQAAASSQAALANTAWRELCDDLDDFGMTCRPSESPRAVGRRVRAAIAADDPAHQAVGRVTTAVEQARYALSPAPAGPLRADVTTIRHALAGQASLATRWRARMLPASTLGPARAALRQALGLIAGWIPSGQAHEGVVSES
jgi:TgpA N-terminal domain/Transglutaminase-like superfamily/Domain of unknown function (DUF4129)